MSTFHMSCLPPEIMDCVYKTLHNQYMKDLSLEIELHIIKPELYQLSIERMIGRIDRSWKTNSDYTIDDNICDLWNWQKYRQKAIHKYYIKLLGYQQYSKNKIQNFDVGHIENFNLLEELKDGTLSLDTLLEESLFESTLNYGTVHKYEYTNQLRMLSELCIIELESI